MVQLGPGSPRSSPPAPQPVDPGPHRARRPGEGVREGAHPAGGLHGPVHRHPRGGPGGVHAPESADAPAAREPPRGLPEDAGEDLLQAGGPEPYREPQAQHCLRPGVLQCPRGRRTAGDGDRGWAVGLGAGPRIRLLRARLQGVHGPGQLRPEAVPQARHESLRGGRHPVPEPPHRIWPECAGGATGSSRLAWGLPSARRWSTPWGIRTPSTPSGACSTT